MGLYFRKSVNLGGGVRLNFSKSGVGVSAGVKGARISTGPSGTYANFSIPGTGIGYRTKLSSLGSGMGNTTNRYPYVRTVTNSYTGRTRTIRAATQWELNSLVEAEQARMRNEELRQREIERANSMRDRADMMTRQIRVEREALNNILNYTLDIDDRLNWDKQYITVKYPEFKFSEPKPVKVERSTDGLFGFFKKKSTNDDNYNERLDEYERHRKSALNKYLADKENFENNQREHNAEIDYLKENFEKNEKSAVEKYTSIILSNSNYPPELDMDFDVEYHRSKKTMVVSFLMPEKSELSLVESYRYSPSNGEIIPKEMNKMEANKFYERILYSICVRTIHEIYEAVYTDAIEKVIFNAYLLRDGVSEWSEDFSDDVRCIFSVSAEKEEFLHLNLDRENIEKIIAYLGINRVKNFESEEMEPILN